MEKLSHFFESARIQDLPQSYKVAQFSTPNATSLEINTVNWIEPREGELVVKVSSCGLHASDQIYKHALLPHLKYPLTPGSFCSGEIVQIGQNVKHLKLHHKVVGVAIHGGGCLAEYAVLNSDHVSEIKRKEGATQQVYSEVFEGSRVEGNTLSLSLSPTSPDQEKLTCGRESLFVAELRRFEKEEKELSKDERRRIHDANERLVFASGGVGGEGVTVVIGDGGSARVAIQVLKHSSTHKDQRVILLTTDTQDRWTHSFYDIDESNHLKLSHNEIGSALKSIGGIRFAIAVTQPPQEGLEQTLEAMRYGSQLVVLSPHPSEKLQVPLAPLVAKSLSIRGAVWPDRTSLGKVLEMVHNHTLHVSSNLYKFTPEGINKAWMDLEKGEKFDQPVVVLDQTFQAVETH
ncbi:hypothetical protein JCM5350_005016 [Sporobolomyces pararoseus]